MKGLQDFFCFFLRIALATFFLSAVADSFGLWGSPGATNVIWGDFEHFQDYVAKLHRFIPHDWLSVFAWCLIGAALIVGLLLLAGLFSSFAAFAGGLILLAFAIGASITFGIKYSINNYSFIAAAGAFLLGTVGPGFLAIRR